MDEENSPLLHERQQAVSGLLGDRLQQWISPEAQSRIQYTRQRLQRFLTSKTGHYSVLLLVALDVSSIFADFVINIYACERHATNPSYSKALDALGLVGLMFSSLFMAELLASIWAFGWEYFNSWFHCFDAVVIIAGFVIDVLLRGVLEEVASLIVVLRLWRVFKIIEELSLGAQEQMEGLQEKIETLQKENEDLRRELSELRSRKRPDNPQDL